jgi:DNA (cytosine-5)-methyltransferase 1
MSGGTYYNEHDPFAAQWLRNLAGAGLIPAGDVDERSVTDVRADDLRGYTACHFFAGISGWPLALGLAGWPDDRPVWTGSCPCQPFSTAGQGAGAKDDRHLWPSWFDLISECKPSVVFGEQVEAAIGWGWLDAVLADLEDQGYAAGAAVLPACGVGAPHVRRRVFWAAVADADGARLEGPHEPRRQKPAQSAARLARWHWCSEPALARVAHGLPKPVGAVARPRQRHRAGGRGRVRQGGRRGLTP